MPDKSQTDKLGQSSDESENDAWLLDLFDSLYSGDWKTVRINSSGSQREVAEMVAVANQMRKLELPEIPPAFRNGLRSQLLTQMAGYPAPVTIPESPRHISRNINRYLLKGRLKMLAYIIALILALTGGGTVFASQSALPGDPLYGVKTSLEAIEMAVTPDQANKGLSIAQERLDEIDELAARGRYEDIPAAAERLAEQLQNAADHADNAKVNEAGSNAVSALEKVLAREGFPEQAVPAVTKALEKIKNRMSNPTAPVEPPIIVPTPPVDKEPIIIPPKPVEPDSKPEVRPTEPSKDPAETLPENPGR